MQRTTEAIQISPRLSLTLGVWVVTSASGRNLGCVAADRSYTLAEAADVGDAGALICDRDQAPHLSQRRCLDPRG